MAAETVDDDTLNPTDTDKSLTEVTDEAGQWSEMFLPLTTSKKQRHMAYTLSLPHHELIRVPENIASKAGAKYLQQLAKGDLVWTGKLLFVRGAKPIFDSKESARDHGYQKGPYYEECTLKPYESLNVSIRHGHDTMIYEIRIKEFRSSGVLISHRKRAT